MSHSTRKRRSHHYHRRQTQQTAEKLSVQHPHQLAHGEPYVDIRGSYDPAGAQVAYVPNDPEQPIGGTAATDIADLTQQATDYLRRFPCHAAKAKRYDRPHQQRRLSYENRSTDRALWKVCTASPNEAQQELR
jgi:hypothetical protein